MQKGARAHTYSAYTHTNWPKHMHTYINKIKWYKVSNAVFNWQFSIFQWRRLYLENPAICFKVKLFKNLQKGNHPSCPTSARAASTARLSASIGHAPCTTPVSPTPVDSLYTWCIFLDINVANEWSHTHTTHTSTPFPHHTHTLTHTWMLPADGGRQQVSAGHESQSCSCIHWVGSADGIICSNPVVVT